MTAHRKDPYRKVAEAQLMKDHLGRWWSLILECGHDDVRRVVYTHRIGLPWGGARKRPVRPVEDAAPAPRKVMCEECGFACTLDYESAAE